MKKQQDELHATERKRLLDEMREKLRAYDLVKNCPADEKELAKLFGELIRDILRYNPDSKSWWYYTEQGVWAKDVEAMRVRQCAKFLHDVLEEHLTDIDNESFRNLVKRLEKRQFRNTIVSDSQDCHYIRYEMMDDKPNLFNCQNGTLDLETLKFMPHNPDDLLTKVANVVYDPEAQCQNWEKFIGEVMEGAKDMALYLQKIFGYGLSAETNLEEFYIAYGQSTRNGKSTCIETIRFLMGGYGQSSQSATLALKPNSSRGPSGDIARMKGVRLSVFSELPQNLKLNAAQMKELTGGDTITARHMFEREFEFFMQGKIFINTNYLPIISDDTLFVSDRIRVIEFKRHFKPEEQDRNLKQKLRDPAELSGILNWCIEGLARYREEGALPPKSVIDATERYRLDNDLIEKFMDECLVAASENVQAKDVHLELERWCRRHEYPSFKKGEFFAYLRRKSLLILQGTVNGKQQSNVIKGYRLVAVQEVPEERRARRNELKMVSGGKSVF